MLKYNLSGIDLEYFIEKRDKYAVYPSCQREYVWKRTMKQKLIDSVFRGLPIPPIVAFVEHDLLIGKRILIVDGQQRIETIYKYVNNEFATALNFRDEPLLKPIYPGLKFKDLTPAARSEFLNYQLQMWMIDGIELEHIETCFRRMNNQLSLTLSEKLHSYSSSPTSKYIEKVAANEFWKVSYLGDKDRLKLYQAGVILLLLETYNGYANLTTPRLLDTAAGKLGKEITDETVGLVKQRLEFAQYLFFGAQIKALYSMIIIYQATMFLQNDGCNRSNCVQGALAYWFNDIYKQALYDHKMGNKNLFGIITKVKEQRSFWQSHFKDIYNLDGIIVPDKKRKFSQIDKLEAWLNQKGICSVCKKTIASEGDAHHVDSYILGGKTDSSNCVVIHRSCHKKIHAETNKLF